MRRFGKLAASAALAGAVALGAWSVPEAPAADHGDSPQVRGINAKQDINDVYLFQSPENSANAVLIMTVCPLAGAIGPATFGEKTAYTFRVDTDGDAIEDQTFIFTFGRADSDGNQNLQVRARGAVRWAQGGSTGDIVLLPNSSKCVAKIFDDPFFFDLIAFKQGFAFNPEGGTNFFRGLNTLAIVLEVPKTTFGTNTIGVWATTHKNRKQVDRMGRPAINTVLVNGPRKDLFNRGRPRDDAAYRADAAAIITAVGNGPNAAALAEFLFPDILTIDFNALPGEGEQQEEEPVGFPNGRKLQDDVIDIELNLLTNGGVPSDFVGNDSPFLSVFPYLSKKNP